MDRSETVLGFELLYRPLSPGSVPPDPGGATSTLIVGSLVDVGLEALAFRRRGSSSGAIALAVDADGGRLEVDVFPSEREGLRGHPSPRRDDHEDGGTSYTFVTGGVTEALRRAQDAAGSLDVLVNGGASINRQFLHAGLVDEVRLRLVPATLGGGARLFDGTRSDLGLVAIAAAATPLVTHLRYIVDQGTSGASGAGAKRRCQVPRVRELRRLRARDAPRFSSSHQGFASRRKLRTT